MNGRTILVYHEQGFGDTLQFVRYLDLVAKRGGKVVFECQPALHDLLLGVAGIDQLIPGGSSLPRFDTQIALLSLPGIFDTTVATIPAGSPYVATSSERIARWREEIRQELTFRPGLPNDGGVKFKVGIAWQGNPKFSGDSLRSIPFRYYTILAAIPGVELISLQKGPGSEQMDALTTQFPIMDLGPRLTTFADTAAAMMSLDLVITSCTAVAHLAGALGVPVWTALQFVPDWRWFLGREDSPWYPSMRLFRQQRFGDWQDVFARLAAALVIAKDTAARHEFA